jgi:hypothetical protein
VEDPSDLEPAREVRRALAAGGFKARDVGLVAVWATGPHSRERARNAVTRGLGRFASGVTTVFDDPNVAARCRTAVERGEVTVAVALTIDPVAGNVALALGKSR